ncbi:hypothetical protein CYMTET_45796 [Cymbomonas tetramitiformis]|uniref:Protein kinase domain-containing protein n=1 Tax=Cymbomonas tetramitiformis TaxID=36881 RepID=A0AAE0EY82_9CHLO|nr:hypothetical protein CYMTET_45796 [Cymbomonas tetramitiformis]
MADAPVLTPFLQRSNLNRWPYEHIRRWTRDDTEQGRQGFAESNKLGEGSFGVVYSALDPNTEQRYAVKKVNEVLLQGTAAQQEFARRNFENEVRTLERFRHPNIVNICGYAIQPRTQRTCLVYELLEGGTLESRLRETGPSSLSWQLRVAIALGLAKALNYLQRGQDTKRAAWGGYFTRGAWWGYFARGAWWGFSFGVVLLELLTGKPPATPDGYYLHHDIQDGTADDPEYLEKSLDAREGVGEWPQELASALCGLARRCLLPHPTRRIQSFQELVRALSVLQRTHCFLAPPPEAVAAVEDAECLACYDSFPMQSGLRCENEHFVCAGCLMGHVRVESEAEQGIHALRARQGEIYCPLKCGARHFAAHDLAAHLDAVSFEMYLAAKIRYTEHEAREHLMGHMLECLESSVCRVEGVDHHRNHIEQRILTNHCPRCDMAWLDYTGCDAVTCPFCNGAFCPFCQEDCGEDAHNHVARECPLLPQDGDFFNGGMERLSHVVKERRLRDTAQYLARLEEAMFREVLEACRIQLEQADLDMPALDRAIRQARENPQQEGRAQNLPQAPQPELPNAEVLQRLEQQHREQLVEERRRLEQQHEEQRQRMEQQRVEERRRLEQQHREQLVEERRRLEQQHEEQHQRMEQQHQEQLMEEQQEAAQAQAVEEADIKELGMEAPCYN